MTVDEQCRNGHEMAAGHAFCPRCGADRAAAVAPQCRNGHTLEAGQAFCPRCGADRADAATYGPIGPAAAAPAPAPPAAAEPATGSTRFGGRKKNPKLGRRIAAGVVVVLAGLVVLATRSDSAHDLTGTVEIADPDGHTGGLGCRGDGGYDDLKWGTPVVRDESGRILATGSLSAGREQADQACEFNLLVDNVPRADFYEIEVSHRGALSYSHDELETLGWNVGFSIG